MTDPITEQQLIDAATDAETLEQFVSGDENTDVTSRLGRSYATLAKMARMTQMAGGLIGFATKTELLAYTPASGSRQLARVYGDGTTANNGDYYWNGTAWVKSGYDPLTESKTYTDDSIRTLESNRLQNPNKFTFEQVNFTTAPTGTTGTVTYPFRNGLKQLKLVSASTGGGISAYWDFNASLFTREFAGSLTIEGADAGSNGYVGIQQISGTGTVLATSYAQTFLVDAIAKKVFRMTSTGVVSGAVKIRLIVYLLTTTTRQMYVHSPFIADGMNAEFIAPEKAANLQPVETAGNTFTVTIDGIDAYIRTEFSDTHDLVQQVRYGTNNIWSNNVINPWSVRTIPKSSARDGVIAAFSSGTVLVSQGDDAAPLIYNGTYIGANHGAYIAHEVTANAHGKTYADVGSRWTQGANTFTIVRVVDANKLWLVSQNIGATYWNFVTSSLSGLALTHSIGATNTASFTPSADTVTQLLPAINNHTKKIIADGFKELTTAGVYGVECIEFIDNYDIMNPVSILSYLQSRVGTATEQNLSVDSIASDVRVSVIYRYALNGSCTVSTQLHKKANINFSFAGLVQASPLNYSGKTLVEYANKMKPVTVGGISYDLSATIDATSNTVAINMLKADWLDATNPPDRMLNLVKNGSNKEFGQVLGYSLTRGATKPSVRQNTTDAGFFNNPTTKKVYPKALVGNLDTVVNAVAYRAIYNPAVLPQATIYTWYEDNGEIFVVLDIHQNASMLKLPLPSMFNGKSATVIDSNANFTLHSEIVSDGGLLCSIINSYGQATIKLT